MPGPSPPKRVVVKLKDASGRSVGKATITRARSSGIAISLDVMDLPPGEHAIHIQEHAKCEAPGFTSAGADFNPPPSIGSPDTHFDPESVHHGINNPLSPHPHAGDMENFTVQANGKVKSTVTNSRVSMDLVGGLGMIPITASGPQPPGPPYDSIFVKGGTALVIYAESDDMKSDPSGNAGDRIACGEIILQR